MDFGTLTLFSTGKDALRTSPWPSPDECDMLAFGIVEGDAEHFAGASGALEDGADEGVLVTINGLDLAGWLFHGTVKVSC